MKAYLASILLIILLIAFIVWLTRYISKALRTGEIRDRNGGGVTSRTYNRVTNPFGFYFMVIGSSILILVLALTVIVITVDLFKINL
jgi:hypothetical protein